MALQPPINPDINSGAVTLAANSLGGNPGMIAGSITSVALGPSFDFSGGTLENVFAFFESNGIVITTDGGADITVGLTPYTAPSLFGNYGTVIGGAVTLGSNISLSAAGLLSSPSLWNAGSVNAIGTNLSISGNTLNASGSATIAAGLGAVNNSGTIQINNILTLNGTAAGTLAISPTTGTSDVLINMPASGGTVTASGAPSFPRQRMLWDVKQGATFGVFNLGTVYKLTGAIGSFTLTPTNGAIDRLEWLSPDGTSWVPLAINQNFTL